MIEPVEYAVRHSTVGKTQGLSRRAALFGMASIFAAGATLLPWRKRWHELTANDIDLPGPEHFSLAYRQARRWRKPLLALFLPAVTQDAAFDRRQAFTDLLVHGDAHELLPLALCRRVVVDMDALSEIFDLTEATLATEMILIETTHERPRGQLLKPGLVLEEKRPLPLQRPARPTYSSGPCEALNRMWCTVGEESRIAACARKLQAEKKRYHVQLERYETTRLAAQDFQERRARYQRLSRTIAAAIAPNEAALVERAREVAQALSATDRKTVERALMNNEPPPRHLCDQAAALVALAAVRTREAAVRERLVRSLATVAAEQCSNDEVCV